MTFRPNGIAPIPDGPFRFGAQDGAVARAWQYVWDRLDRTQAKDGRELADLAAKHYSLKPLSVVAVLHRMATAGVLEREAREVKVTAERDLRVRDAAGKPVKDERGRYIKRTMPYETTRTRTFYRIAK